MSRWTLRTLKNEAQGGPGADVSLDKDVETNITRSSLEEGSRSTFKVGIVEEVISNPYDYFYRPLGDGSKTANRKTITVGDAFSGRIKKDDNNNPIQTPYLNSSVVDYAPANSISVFLNEQISGGASGKTILCFPFFSSHMMMPVKPGESVWVIKFNENIYYWICRQPSFRQVEDTNFTLGQREEAISNVGSSKDENTYTHFLGGFSKGNSINVQSILNSSIASGEEFTGEPVPRQVKDCGDFLIQGSNNSHIYLGKEKFEEPGTTASQEEFTTVSSQTDANQFRKPTSPAIDLCVLRKAKEIFELKSLTRSNEISGNIISVEGSGLSASAGLQNPFDARYYENEKTRDKLGKEIFEEEFYDSDIYNCTARLYLTNASSIDDILFSSDYSKEPDLSASPQDLTSVGDFGTLAAISTNTRIVGTETIKIHNVAGSSGIQFTPDGDVIIFANEEGGAKIVLESGGDVRIVPGVNGILKLGADDAVGGLVAAADSLRTLGNVEAQTIMTTAAGLVAVPKQPHTGTFSNKVLIAFPSI